jgi:hypothetical protein
LEYNGVYLAEGPWPAKAYFDAKRRARARDAGLYLNYGFTRPEVFSEGPFPQFQNSDGTSGHEAGSPTEAAPEDVAPPQPQHGMSPRDGMELPAPALEGSLNNSGEPRLMSAGNRRAPSGNSTLGPQTNVSQNILRQGGVQSSAAKFSRPDTQAEGHDAGGQVRQASATSEAPFDWGDLSLGKPDNGGSKTSQSISAGSTNTSQWKSPGSNESDTAQSNTTDDRPSSGWKRAQH